MIPLIDAHTHIHFPAYDKDRKAVLERARQANLKIVTVGTQVSTSRTAVILARQNKDFIWATVGFHPNHIGSQWYHDQSEQAEAEQEEFDADALTELAEDPSVIAIGECGLDYYRLPEGDNSKIKQEQAKVFAAQRSIAEQLHKPLMIHCRPSKGTDDAYEDMIGLLRGVTVPFIFHFYAGSPAMTEKLVTLGAYFTFGGVITFSSDYNESIARIPLNTILLETDAPYVAPAGHRGERNESSFIGETYRRMAELKEIEYDVLVKNIAATFEKLFHVKV